MLRCANLNTARLRPDEMSETLLGGKLGISAVHVLACEEIYDMFRPRKRGSEEVEIFHFPNVGGVESAKS